MVNNIYEIDPTCYDNERFSSYDEENDCYMDMYQYFLTNLNEGDVEFLEKRFDNMLFTYSDLLDCYVLCVNHFGTSWSYVHCEVIDEEMAERVKTQKLTYKDLTGQEF